MDYAQAQILAAAHATFDAWLLVTSDIQWKTLPRADWSHRAMAVGRGLLIGVPLLPVTEAGG